MAVVAACGRLGGGSLSLEICGGGLIHSGRRKIGGEEGGWGWWLWLWLWLLFSE